MVGVARCISYHGRLTVVSDLGSNLARGADAGVAPAADEGTTATSHHLEVCSHLGCALLGRDVRVLILGAIAPDGGFLLAKERNVAGWLGDGPSRTARDGASEVCGGRGAVSSGGLHTGCGAEGVD